MPKIQPTKQKSKLLFESFPRQNSSIKRKQLSCKDYDDDEVDVEYFHNFYDTIKKSKINFTELLQVHFPSNQFKIERTNINNYKISSLDGTQECLDFRINCHFDDETKEYKGLFIDSDFTSKCHIPATESIQRLIRFAETNGFSGYTVSDESHLEFQCPGKKMIHISLGRLNTLATGQSWYNKFGFIPDENDYADTHERNMIRNAQFIKTPIRIFLQNLKKKEEALEAEKTLRESKNQYFNLFNLDKIQEIQKEFQDLLQLFSFGGNEDKTIQDFFTHIKNVMKNETNFCSERYIVLDEVLFKLDEEFIGLHEYPLRLTKKIQRAGKKTRKRRRRTRHSRKLFK